MAESPKIPNIAERQARINFDSMLLQLREVNSMKIDNGQNRPY